MADSKYSKYFIRGATEGFFDQGAIGYIDQNRIEGSFFFLATYIRPDEVPAYHGPHQHESSEVLAYFGTNPDDPFELGGEITLYMGEEMEKHTFNKSTIVYIPPEMVHCPIVYDHVDKPILFVYTMPRSVLQERSRKDLLHRVPVEIRDKLIFPHDE